MKTATSTCGHIYEVLILIGVVVAVLATMVVKIMVDSGYFGEVFLGLRGLNRWQQHARSYAADGFLDDHGDRMFYF
jgi:hypothetical protein